MSGVVNPTFLLHKKTGAESSDLSVRMNVGCWMVQYQKCYLLLFALM